MVQRRLLVNVINPENPAAAPPMVAWCLLEFDALADPLTVKMTFQQAGYEDRVWRVARSLLADGILSPVPHGQGDIKLRVHGQNVQMCFTSNRDVRHAHVHFSHSGMKDFLDATERVLDADAAQEVIDRDLDAFLADVLGGGDRT